MLSNGQMGTGWQPRSKANGRLSNQFLNPRQVKLDSKGGSHLSLGTDSGICHPVPVGNSPQILDKAESQVLSISVQANTSTVLGLYLWSMSCQLSMQSALRQVPSKYCCLIPTEFNWPCMAGFSFPSQISLTGQRAPGFAISPIHTILHTEHPTIRADIMQDFIFAYVVYIIDQSQRNRLLQQSLPSLYYKWPAIKTHHMKRYFYSGNSLAKNWLDSQYNMARLEDQIYRDALLAALRLQPQKVSQFGQLRQTFLNMTIREQAQYARNSHMESLFKHFNALHKNSRGRKMIVRGKQSLSKDLVDPDKFPIWDLKKKPNVFYSIWNTIIGKVRYDIGHQLVVRNSLIQHPQGGRGVFVALASNKKQIQIGELLGLVPGSIYGSYQTYKKIRLNSIKSYERVPQHLHFPTGKVLQLGEYKQHDDMTNTEANFQPFMVNPYAMGQFVNHPPYGCKPNVIFTEIECNANFFPTYLQKYLPYNSYLPLQVKQKSKKMLAFGIFARQPIKNNEQLYVDYCQNHIYPIDKIPQWMIEPDYKAQVEDKQRIQNLNFNKQQYENPAPSYWQLIENQALKQNEQLYRKYLNIVKYRPNKVLYEDEGVKISSMNLRQSKSTPKQQTKAQ